MEISGMSSFVSLLRGINVGGQKKIHMESLRHVYETLGYTHVRTYVQSGNVVFESSGYTPSELVKQIEEQIEKTLGFNVPVFIRQADELQDILTRNPFLYDRNEDPSKLHVTFLYQPASKSDRENISAPRDIADEFTLGESVIYLYCPNGYGKTKLTNGFFERKLGISVTTRNWNTVNALYKMVLEK
jgi:uncharacterized protein (DUF1697 family)